MPATFIIDAYNAIRLVLQPGELARGFEQSRQAFETRMRTFRRANGPGTRMYVVYDGELGRAAPARNEKGFEVYFSRPPKKADDVVLDLAHKHEGEPGLCVVTSDFTDIARYLHGLRLEHMTSRDFADLVRRRLAPRGEKRRPGDDSRDAKPETLSPGEVDAWTHEFGFGDDSRGGKT